MKALLFSFIFLCPSLFAQLAPTWSKGEIVINGLARENILNLSQKDFEAYKLAGMKHAMNYPVEVTGLLVPYRPFLNLLKFTDKNPILDIIEEVIGEFTSFKNEKEFYQWLGLNTYNSKNVVSRYQIPYPNGKPDQFYLGAGLVDVNGTKGLTFSCYTCHSGNLFGTTVIGLTNKRVRANELFVIAKDVIPHVPTTMFQIFSRASNEEAQMQRRTKYNLAAVGGKNPQVLGLDTSLPQVALSLARRNPDEIASKNSQFELNPRPNFLNNYVADSKPAVWWNAKYKNKWLLDGSVVSGNPIFTNILWNEIGRGADLVVLENWLSKNKKVVDELTVAVFASKAPLWTDFFDPKTIDLDRAIKGQDIFRDSCMKCHGDYIKGWEMGDSSMALLDQLKTVKVEYFEDTPIHDVGTDPQRRIGMKAFYKELNNLRISKKTNTLVVPSEGYVPPPLDGIWARYPYMHNNSIPNLCALMTAPHKRPKFFIQGPANDKKTEYDSDCVGYPIGEKIPQAWLSDRDAFFDTSKPGLSNMGHYEMFLKDDGTEKYSEEEKRDLREFLKTL